MTIRKVVSLPEDLAKRLEDFRFNNRIKSEAEAMRRLIELGLRETDSASDASSSGSASDAGDMTRTTDATDADASDGMFDD